MFKVGDKVVYPLYGAGIVEAIEDRPHDDGISSYYVLKVPVGNLKITVSTAKSQLLGLRKVHTKDEVINIVEKSEPIAMSKNWTQRNKDNMAILKSGELDKIVSVFKTLMMRERMRTLSSAEKKLLGTTKQVILTEMILSLDTDRFSAESMLTKSMQFSA